MRRAARGFTLIELLVSIAIFSLIAGMLFQMIRDALDMWSTGERNRESMEKGATLVYEIAKEMRMMRAEPVPGDDRAQVRLLLDFGAYDLDADQKEETVVQRLRFVRSLPEERFDERLRRAGDLAWGDSHLGDVVDRDAVGLPPSGMAEVGYLTMRLPGGKDPALLALVRLFRTPIGGEDSLFATNALSLPRDVMVSGVVMAENILYLGFEFWSRDTKTWDVPEGAPDGPLTVWDSTRALLTADDPLNPFPLALGEESLARADDDVFPRRARITLVIERDADEANPTRLAAPVSADDATIRIASSRALPASAPFPYVKIGGEWMRYSSVSGNTVRVERGVRGTAAVDHEAGAVVHLGDTWRRVVEIPVYREDWNSR